MHRFLVALALLFASPAIAGPTVVQARLLNSTGDALTGSPTVEVRLFDSPSGPTEVWSHSFGSTPVVDGYVSLSLDAPASAFAGPRWVEFVVDNIALSPRQLVASTPRSLTTDAVASWSSTTSLPAGGGTISVDHAAMPTDRIVTSVWRVVDSNRREEIGPVRPSDERYGDGRDGVVTLGAGTHSLADVFPSYDGWSRIAQVKRLSLTDGAVLTVPAYDGQAFGRVMIRAQESIDICSTCRIDVVGKGYAGGCINPINSSVAGIPGQGPGGGRAAGRGNSCGHGGGGGGGGYGSEGADGTPDLDRCNPGVQSANTGRFHGARGVTYGDSTIRTVFMGSGGASASDGHDYLLNAAEPGCGGNGGGAIALWAPTITNAGQLLAHGSTGTPTSWGTVASNPQVASGAGGSGGSIRLEGQVVSNGTMSALGGARGIAQGWGTSTNQANGQRGGAGGVGRMYVLRSSGVHTASGSGETITANTVGASALAPVRGCSQQSHVVNTTRVETVVSCTEAEDVVVVVTALP